MVPVEYLPRFFNIYFTAFFHGPRESNQPIEVSAGNVVFGGGDRHPSKPDQFLLYHFFCLLRYSGTFYRFLQVLQFLEFLISLSKLFPDNLQLLAQKIFSLILAEFTLRFLLYLIAEFEHFEFSHQ